MPDDGVTELGTAADIERVAALGWRGLEEERLGEWLLRAGNGFTGRANSVLPVGDPGRDLGSAVGAVAAWYRQRGLRPLVQVPLPLCTEVDEVLAAHGWRAFNPSHVLVGRVSSLVDNAPPRPDLPAATLSAWPTPEWLAAYRYRGKDLPAGAADILARAADPVFVSVPSESAPGPGPDGVLAVGRGVVDEGWLGVTAVTVHDAHRRRGLATYVMQALASWASDRGAERLYLQVAGDNTAALAMYARLGVHRHHDYHYRTLDPAS